MSCLILILRQLTSNVLCQAGVTQCQYREGGEKQQKPHTCTRRFHLQAEHAAPKMPEKVALVIGGGVAGATCAAELAALTAGRGVRVTLTDPRDVVKVPSSVVSVSRAAEAVEISEARAAAWCAEQGMRFKCARARHLEQTVLVLNSGERVSFDVCCVATGARPYMPKSLRDARFAELVLCIRDTDSVSELRRRISAARRVVVVGNGGIAMELVHEIAGCQVVWVMRSAHAGSAFFDARGGETMIQFLTRDCGAEDGVIRHSTGMATNSKAVETKKPDIEKHASSAGVGPHWLRHREVPLLFDRNGQLQQPQPSEQTNAPPLIGNVTNGQFRRVRTEVNCEVEALEPDREGKWPVVVCLTNGVRVGCDLILAATGVTPNSEWLRGSPVQVDFAGLDERESSSYPTAPGGIFAAAQTLETNVRGIFAAGDCSTVRAGDSESESLGENWFQMQLWTQARTAGRVAAQNMAARLLNDEVGCAGLEFELFAHATQFFGKRVVFLGRYNAQGLEDGYRMLEGGGGAEDDYFVRVVLVDGRMRGALLVGEVELAETFENLILDGLDVSRFGAELVDPAIDLEDYFD